MKFCSKCGKQLNDDAVFCDGCGARVDGASTPEKKEGPIKEGKVFKCPFCGDILPFDAVKCPSCGKEIRGREITSAVQSFFEKYSSIDDEEKKMDLIKAYPIPNSREDILEFMFLASSNFDAKYYATNKKKDSMASAWYTKIQQCYQKGQMMFNDPADLQKLENIYKKVNEDTKKVSKTRLIMICSGIGAIVLSLIFIMNGQETVTNADGTTSSTSGPLGYVGIILLTLGIIALVIGCKRKKTNKEIEEKKLKSKEKKN